jgi:MraZ protein
MDDTGIRVEAEPTGLCIFVSQYRHALDPKKRFTIPSQWRSAAGTNLLYILPDISMKFLCAFPSTEIRHRLQKLRQHPMADSRAREFARVIGSRSDLVAWDPHGRIRIKDELLDLAGIREEVWLVGALDRFEIWSVERYKQAQASDQASFEEAARYVGF